MRVIAKDISFDDQPATIVKLDNEARVYGEVWTNDLNAARHLF
jgi:hypothetical protein